MAARKIGRGKDLVGRAFAITLVLCATETAVEAQIKRESELRAQLARAPLTFFIAYGDDGVCGPGCSKWIAVEGQFDKGSAVRFAAFVKRAEADTLPVFLNSKGGLTDEGIAFGRFLNRNGMRAGIAVTQARCADQRNAACRAAMAAGRPVQARWTGNNALCSSACFFALMGAATRSIPQEARVGVHSTAYFCFREDGRVMQPIGQSRDAAECRSKLTRRASQLSQYFAEMGISSELVRLMNNVPSSEIRFLTSDEIAYFRIANEKSSLDK